LLGIAYLLLRWFLLKNIDDLYFVIILIIANTILILGILLIYNFISKNAFKFFKESSPYKTDSEIESDIYNLLKKIYNKTFMTITGIALGTLIAFGPMILSIEIKPASLQVLFMLYEFSINFNMGIVLFSLSAFFFFTIKRGQELIVVDLWDRDNYTIAFFRTITVRLTIIGSIYLSLVVISIIFSAIYDYNNKLVIIYSSIAASFVLTYFIIPEIPIRRKIYSKKKEALDQVNKQLQKEFNNKLELIRIESNRINLDKVEQLINIRNAIIRSSSFPDIWRTVGNVLMILAINSIPIIISFLQET
jgi:hypothetical protein